MTEEIKKSRSSMLIPKFLFNQAMIALTLYLFSFNLSEFFQRPIQYQIIQLIIVLPLFEFGLLYFIMDWRFMDDCGNPISRMSIWRRVLGDWNARVIVYLMGLIILGFLFVLPPCVLTRCKCGKDLNKCEGLPGIGRLIPSETIGKD